MTAYEIRAYPGAAADTTLDGSMTAAALGFSVAAGSGGGFPDGTAGPFYVVIDYDTSSTEKVHCTGRVGDVFSVDQRGADGTTAIGHAYPAKLRACWTATDAAEANKAAHETVGRVTSKGDLLTGASASTLTRTAVGSDGRVLQADSTQTGGVGWTNILTGISLDATSTVDGITGTQIAADHATTAANVTAIGTDEAAITALQALNAGTLSGTLASPMTSTGSGQLFSIALATGTYVINVASHITCSGTAGGLLRTGVSTGSMTLLGASGAVGGAVPTVPSGSIITPSLTFTAVVTVAGNLLVTVSLGSSAQVDASGQTGYTAIKVA